MSEHLSSDAAAAWRRLEAARRAETRRVLRLVAGLYRVTPAQLHRYGRTRILAEARQVAMFLLRKDLGLTATHIGRIFHRDHATVLHDVQVIARRHTADRTLHWVLGYLRATLERDDGRARRRAR